MSDSSGEDDDEILSAEKIGEKYNLRSSIKEKLVEFSRKHKELRIRYIKKA